MFPTIFVTCLIISQLFLSSASSASQRFPVWLVFSLCALSGLFLLIVLLARARARTGPLAHNHHEKETHSLNWKRIIRKQTATFCYLIVIVIQVSITIATADEQQRMYESVVQNVHEREENIYVHGKIIRDGTLTYSGNSVNYMAIGFIEHQNGQRFSAGGKVLLYGMDQRYFRGREIVVHLPGGLTPTDRSSFLRTGFHYTAIPGNTDITGASAYNTAGEGNARSIDLIRADLRKKIDGALLQVSPVSRSFMQSLIFGYRSEMGSGLSDLFRDSGVIHILVLSGMHLGIIYYVLRALIPIFIPPLLREILAILLIGLYLWFISPGVSAWRAAVMIVLVMPTKWSGWKISNNTMLTLTWTFLIAIRSGLIFDAGMYLSFGAVWGLSYMGVVFRFMSGRIAWFINRGVRVRAPGVRVPRAQQTAGVGKREAPVQSPVRQNVPVHSDFSGSIGFFSRITIFLRQRFEDIFIPSISAQSIVGIIVLILFGTVAPQGIIILPCILPFFYLSLVVSVLMVPLLFTPYIQLPAAILEWLIDAMNFLLFPAARFGIALNALPLFLKIIIAIIPALLAAYCTWRNSLIPSGHVQLRFSTEHNKAPDVP